MRAAQTERRPRYLPIDELLELPRVRMLRVLAHFDEVRAEDLWVALDVHGITRDNATTQTLSRLVREGHVARRPGGFSAGISYIYRITAAGRSDLAATLDRARPERELGELDDDEADEGIVPTQALALRKRMRVANRVTRWRARRGAA